MNRAQIHGRELEYEVRGAGEPVVLVHGSHIADAFAPLLAEPVLTERYQLILYHRRGFAGSTHPDGPLSIAQQATDCRALMQHLGVLCAHVVGPEYRRVLDRVLPGAFAQAVADADTFFRIELPALEQWSFTQAEAGRITQPILAVLGADSHALRPGWIEVHHLVQAWLPQAEAFVLKGATHGLQIIDPQGMAAGLADFFARHPLPDRP
jgi:pimeloyl-ACP methyl ester carboxylesterase